MPLSWETLKQRKLVQWAVAYLAGAWLVLQVLGLVAEPFAWPVLVMRAAVVLLAVGFFAALVLAWYHGERGEQRVSGIELFMLAGILAIAGAAVAWVSGEAIPRSVAGAVTGAEGEDAGASAPLVAKSVAILPFENLSDDPANAYLASGLQDEILVQISKVLDLNVASRGSVEGYANTTKLPPQIARELGVANLLDGSVQRMGDRIRVAVQLSDARRNKVLWASSYDRESTDLFAVQSEIAQAIVAALEATLTAREKVDLATAPTRNAEAYDLYLRAREYQLRSVRGPDLRAAVQLYRRAISLDSTFALAHARLSTVLGFLYRASGDRTDAQREEIRSVAETALRLHPGLPEARLAMGYYWYLGHADYPRALKEFEGAQRDLPNDGEVLAAIAYVHRKQGRWDDALVAFQRWEKRSPRDVNPPINLYDMYFHLRRFPEALQAMDRSIELAPDNKEFLLRRGRLFIRWQGITDSLAVALRRVPPGSDNDVLILQAQLELARLERRPADGVALLLGMPREELRFGSARGRMVLLGRLYEQMGDQARARVAYEEVRPLLEQAASENPDDLAILNSLARTYAGLGMRREALRAAERRTQLLPISDDAVDGVAAQITAARVHARLGDAAAAVRTLEPLLRLPAGPTVAELRIDPDWDLIRRDPRFQRLLADAGAG